MTRATVLSIFENVLREATAAMPEHTFVLPVDGGPAVKRERVYSYELYSQIRGRWPDDCPYILHGEVDKSGHPILGPLGVKSRKPDLLLHTPGDMKGNMAVIEIKPVGANAKSREKDISSLNFFRDRARGGYRRAIYLFFGATADSELVAKVKRQWKSSSRRQEIDLWLHKAAGEPARRIARLKPPK